MEEDRRGYKRIGADGSFLFFIGFFRSTPEVISGVDCY